MPPNDMPTDELGAALDELVDAELFFRHGSPPDATYSFKHALVQDAAYQSLLRSRRQQLHARIVGAIQQHLPDLVEQQPEVVAHHLSEAGMLAEASSAGARPRSGRRATRRIGRPRRTPAKASSCSGDYPRRGNGRSRSSRSN
jgi:hypothetical protein